MRITDSDWEDEERMSLQAGRRAAFESHCGRLISVTSDALFLRHTNGREDTLLLDSNVKLTINGKPCRVEELIVGRGIRVTRKIGDVRGVTLIDMPGDDAP